jgi:RimJ/RimL family protein N-acetyltransferase
MEIRPLTRTDAEPFRQLRRERLENSPRAFAESIEEHDAVPIATMASRLAASSGDNFVVGAFDDSGTLIAMAGFARSTRAKTRHKATIWGVYVRPDCRGKGVGRDVLEALLERARAQPGLEQIALHVAADAPAARGLYEALGFEVFGHERHSLKVDGEYVDQDHMVLRLNRRDNQQNRDRQEAEDRSL